LPVQFLRQNDILDVVCTVAQKVRRAARVQPILDRVAFGALTIIIDPTPLHIRSAHNGALKERRGRICHNGADPRKAHIQMPRGKEDAPRAIRIIAHNIIVHRVPIARILHGLHLAAKTEEQKRCLHHDDRANETLYDGRVALDDFRGKELPQTHGEKDEIDCRRHTHPLLRFPQSFVKRQMVEQEIRYLATDRNPYARRQNHGDNKEQSRPDCHGAIFFLFRPQADDESPNDERQQKEEAAAPVIGDGRKIQIAELVFAPKARHHKHITQSIGTRFSGRLERDEILLGNTRAYELPERGRSRHAADNPIRVQNKCDTDED